MNVSYSRRSSRFSSHCIETLQQLDYLRQARCHEGQGYLFSRPVGEAALAELLRQGRVAASNATFRVVPYSRQRPI